MVVVLSIIESMLSVLLRTLASLQAVKLPTLTARSHVSLIMRAIANTNNDDSLIDLPNRGADLLRNHLRRLQLSPTETLLLDGGTGEELFRRGVPDDRKIWSATAIVNEQYHSVVEDVHRSFVKAGSQAITTNSYGITPGVGFTDGEEVKRLVGIAGQIARRAVTTSSSLTPSALVLGSLGPLVESYRPDLIMNHADGVVAYQFAVHGLYPHIDVYLAETISCVEEACQAIDAISIFYCGLKENDHDPKHPLLVSFTLNQDGNLRDGEAVVEAIPKVTEYAYRKKVNREYHHSVRIISRCCNQSVDYFSMHANRLVGYYKSDRSSIQLL